jgi:hypothetical protein
VPVCRIEHNQLIEKNFFQETEGGGARPAVTLGVSAGVRADLARQLPPRCGP